MKIVCSGGGDRDVSYPLDKHFCSWFESTSKILYWAMAMDGSGPTYPECFSWIKETLGQFGITQIKMWTSLTGHIPKELANFDGLYIGGGNTFRLLRQIREEGWFDALAEAIKVGLPTYGGSAGAIILGKNILTSNDPDQSPEQLLNTDGLNLLGGASIWCHYQFSENQKIRAYVEKFGIPVIACPESSGIVLEDHQRRIVGFESSYKFNFKIEEEFPPGSSLVE